MGRGNLPPTMKPGIVAAAHGGGVPVVISSRYGAGSVQERYGYEGGGHDLAQLGVIFAGPAERAQGADEADGRARLHGRCRAVLRDDLR